MADGGDGLVGISKMAHDFKNAGVKPKVLRRSAARNEERIVILRSNFVKSRIQSEVVASLFAIGLVPLEVVDGCPDRVANLLLRTDGINDMPHHAQRLEGNHHFVIFNVIANEHEDLLDSHDECSPDAIVALLHLEQEQPRLPVIEFFGTKENSQCHPHSKAS